MLLQRRAEKKPPTFCFRERNQRFSCICIFLRKDADFRLSLTLKKTFFYKDKINFEIDGGNFFWNLLFESF